MTQMSCVSPFRCRMWDLHDRLDAHVTEETCKLEIESVAKHGQLVPVLARRLAGDANYDFELIYGARRLFVARHLNKPLSLEVRDLSDRDAIVAMDIENRHRRDISPYERGRSYARWLRAGYFQSQEEVAAHLKVSASQVSRLLKMARLPSVVVGAFESATDICEVWGLALAEALEDPVRRPMLIDRARRIATQTPRPRPADTFRRIMAGPRSSKLTHAAHDEIVSGAGNTPLFRIKFQRNLVVLLLPASSISSKKLTQIKDSLKTIMQDASVLHEETYNTLTRNRVASCATVAGSVPFVSTPVANRTVAGR